MKISQVMTKDVVTASPADSLRLAAEIMERNDFDAVPVCEDSRLIGMLTVQDIAIKAVENDLSLDDLKVANLMTFEAKYVFADQPISYAINFMIEHSLRRLLVLDRDYQLLGIVSLDDLADISVQIETVRLVDMHTWPSRIKRPRKQHNDYPDLVSAL
jgi:CBS domain-containing protein